MGCTLAGLFFLRDDTETRPSSLGCLSVSHRASPDAGLGSRPWRWVLGVLVPPCARRHLFTSLRVNVIARAPWCLTTSSSGLPGPDCTWWRALVVTEGWERGGADPMCRHTVRDSYTSASRQQ